MVQCNAMFNGGGGRSGASSSRPNTMPFLSSGSMYVCMYVCMYMWLLEASGPAWISATQWKSVFKKNHQMIPVAKKLVFGSSIVKELRSRVSSPLPNTPPPKLSLVLRRIYLPALQVALSP